MRIRLKRTGDEVDLPSGYAKPLIERGAAVEVMPAPAVETTALEYDVERAVTAAHRPPRRHVSTRKGK